ncbi:hypothetical protein A6R68_16829 [Neotoma lepida]|uniref:Uncharacterized protein n=1 Tax=Neotoma lepida TaxID=56216 RepID=A0A1A6HFL2_NEOLE|nr:hypothetical protein A6R68_16829 [Neotoma lepida]
MRILGPPAGVHRELVLAGNSEYRTALPRTVMQPPSGMPLPSADIALPPYEPPGHPMPQPGFVPPHLMESNQRDSPGRTNSHNSLVLSGTS